MQFNFTRSRRLDDGAALVQLYEQVIERIVDQLELTLLGQPEIGPRVQENLSLTAGARINHVP